MLQEFSVATRMLLHITAQLDRVAPLELFTENEKYTIVFFLLFLLNSYGQEGNPIPSGYLLFYSFVLLPVQPKTFLSQNADKLFVKAFFNN
jgi:hypothetical protein